MPDADRHFELVEQHRAIERIRQTLDALEDAAVPYVVEGGWAVAAHGSPVPSMDLDILVQGGLSGAVAERVEAATGLQLHTAAAHEALGIDVGDSDAPNRLLGTDGVAYVPARLLEGHVEVRRVGLLEGRPIPVPEADRLAFMKLKAFRDRRLQWEATRQRYLLAAIDEDLRAITIRAGEPYWLRKAGKDLFDLGHLLGGATTMERVALAAPAAAWAHLPASLVDVPLPLQQFASDMAHRAGVAWRPPWTD